MKTRKRPAKRKAATRRAATAPRRRRSGRAPQVPTGLLLIGHGSRVPEANRILTEVAAALRRRFRGYVVESCFLEIAQPDIQAGIDRCVAQGAARVMFVPYFLYLGGHVGRDLPEHIAQGRDRYPGLEIRIAPHLGLDRRIVAVVEERVRQGLRSGGWGG
jgi:sirohydrochlorin ferrochelatase